MSIPEGRQAQLLDLKRKIYQTYIIVFKRTRKIRLRTKILNFLGVAIPLIGGGIIMAFYANQRVPETVLIIAAACGLVQIVMSLWALSDGWDEQGKFNELTLAKFTVLRQQIENFRESGDATRDDNLLRNLEYQSYEGVAYDNRLGVDQPERDAGWDAALKKFPD
jgi:mobilome CxxCx(11)CxxC protein